MQEQEHHPSHESKADMHAVTIQIGRNVLPQGNPRGWMSHWCRRWQHLHLVFTEKSLQGVQRVQLLSLCWEQVYKWITSLPSVSLTLAVIIFCCPAGSCFIFMFIIPAHLYVGPANQVKGPFSKIIHLF